MPRRLALISLLAAACSGGTVQKASVADKVTTLQVPHSPEECEAAAKKPVPAAKGACKGMWFSTHLSEIQKRQKEVDSYTPDRTYFTRGFTYDHLLNAISPGARKKWLTGANALDFEACPTLQAALCNLAHSAEAKLPTYLPDVKHYAAHNSSEEKLMLKAINELENHTVYTVGLEQDTWLIDKNGLGLPTARYKHGMAWVRYALDDHPYCHAYYINVVQEYSGGGTYGDTEARFIEDYVVGCPPK